MTFQSNNVLLCQQYMEGKYLFLHTFSNNSVLIFSFLSPDLKLIFLKFRITCPFSKTPSEMPHPLWILSSLILGSLLCSETFVAHVLSFCGTFHIILYAELSFLILNLDHIVAQKGEVIHPLYYFLNISTEAVHGKLLHFLPNRIQLISQRNGSLRLGIKGWLCILLRKLQASCCRILSLTKQLNQADIPCLLIKSTAWTSRVSEANWQEWQHYTVY